MQLRLRTLVFLIVICAQASAQNCPSDPFFTTNATIQGNNLRAWPWGLAGTFNDFLTGNFQKNYSGDSDIPTAGLAISKMWAGGLTPTQQLKFIGSTYFTDEGTYTAGPIGENGEQDPSNCYNWNKNWQVTRDAIEAHRADWADNGVINQPLPAIMGWPGKGNPYFEGISGFSLPNYLNELAPFYDRNGDGFYNPLDGEYPHPNQLDPNIAVSTMIWNIANGLSNPTGSFPFDIQFTGWALDCDNNTVLDNTIFGTYRLVNRSPERIDSFAIGLWRDLDLGNYSEDYVGNSIELSSSYVYNKYAFDSIWIAIGGPIPSFGANPPAMATTFLNHDLYASLYATNGFGSLESDFSSVKYGYLHGLKEYLGTTTPFIDPSGNPTKIQFYDNPNNPSGWSMLNANTPNFDIIALSSVYIGTLQPGASATMDVAYSVHQGDGLGHLGNVDLMYDEVADLRTQYDQQFAGACSYSVCTPSEDCVWPGDANKDGIVNHVDVLNMGLTWTKEGPARLDLPRWTATKANDWNDTFNNGLNQKHADASGNGVVDTADFQMLEDFFLFKKPNYQPFAPIYNNGNELVFATSPLTLNPDSVRTGKNVIVRVLLANPIPDLYGIAFTLMFDTSYWSLPFLNNDQSVKLFEVSYSDAEQGVLLSSKVGPALPMLPNAQLDNILLQARQLTPGLPDTTFIRLANIRGIRSDGTPVELGSQSLRFRFISGTSDTDAPVVTAPQLELSPNPTHNRLFVAVSDPTPSIRVSLSDQMGRQVLQTTMGNGAEIDLSALPAGLYILQAYSEGGQVWVEKVVKM